MATTEELLRERGDELSCQAADELRRLVMMNMETALCTATGVNFNNPCEVLRWMADQLDHNMPGAGHPDRLQHLAQRQGAFPQALPRFLPAHHPATGHMNARLPFSCQQCRG